MTALLNTLRDLGVGFAIALVLSIVFLYEPILREAVAKRLRIRKEDRDLQQRVGDWPRPVPFREESVDLGAAISGEDFAQYHLQDPSELRRAG